MHLTRSDPRPRRTLWVSLALVSLLAVAFIANRVWFSPPLRAFEARREMMDTFVEVIVYAWDDEDAQRATDAALERIAEVEAIASIYDEQAEAFRLNRDGRLEDPSPELLEILDASVRISRLTEGAFDVTIEPLLALWRYDSSVTSQFWELEQADQEAAIEEVMARIGSDLIRVSTEAGSWIRLSPGVAITLGGIAKGYAVDQGLVALRERGVRYALIDAGGDIGVMGGKPDGTPWQIALRNPGDADDALTRFEIVDGAIATSGNYERYFDPDAQVGHIMDPRTGFSAQEASSATVIATSCTDADALATALFVLGPVEGVALAERLEGVEAMVLDYDEPRVIARTEGLAAYERPVKGGR